MKLRGRRDDERHIESLARTAQLEMSMGVGSWQDTLAQMHELIGRLDAERQMHRATEDTLISQLRQTVGHLEAVISRREDEYDRLQEKYIRLRAAAEAAIGSASR